MYSYRPSSIHRLEAALDEACEDLGCRVRVCDRGTLATAWRRGVERATEGARDMPGWRLGPGRLLAVTWRHPGGAPVLLIGEWVMMSRDAPLLRRAAGAVQAMTLAATRGDGMYAGVRQQYAAIQHVGGVLLARQAPRPSIELWDTGEDGPVW